MEIATYDLLSLAVEAHDGQYRRDGRTPYVTHPIAVASILEFYGHTSHIIQGTAYCHDIIEDCDQEFHEKLWLLCPSVHKRVMLLSNKDTFEQTCETLKHADYQTQLVKCADIKHNTLGSSNLKWLAKYRKKKLIQLTYLTKIQGTNLYRDTVAQCQEDPYDG